MSDNTGEQVEGGMLVAGWWMPDGEDHLRDMIVNKSKVGDVDGRGSYQFHKLRRVWEHVTEWGRAIDVGSHVGLFAWHLAKRFERVECFDPIPLHWSLLEANMRDRPNYEMHRCALGADFGDCTLDYTPTNSGRTHVTPAAVQANDELRTTNPDGAAIEIISARVVPLDHFVFEDVGFIKIDVEGFELEVLRGAVDTMTRNRCAVMIEQKGNEENNFGARKHAAKKFLSDLGMREAWNISGDHLFVWP